MNQLMNVLSRWMRKTSIAKKGRRKAEGARLHGLERFTHVKEVEVEEKATKTYNLVVADFHSYFVGSEAILSHDNSIVEPIECLVPGLKIN